MTNKQIIINEVDVSWCEWIREIELDSEYICTCNSLNKTSSYCKDNPNCYYKQLKEKEQECKELKQYKSLFEKTRNLWNESRMNNYKLLDEIEDLKDSLKRTICQSECYKHKEADKLKQILIEIKELIQSDYCTEIGSCEFCAEIGNCLNRKIIHKISECEETK